MPTLAETQHRLWQLISAPDGVAEALQRQADDGEQALAGWIIGDATLDATRRLDVYANAYFERIHDCLASEFGALASLLGEAGFRDLVTAYLIRHPSQHASLRWVGGALPAYLRRAAQAEPFRRRWPWAGNLAQFEWALSTAFDAADVAALGRDTLAATDPEAWDPLVFQFAPSFALVETEWPIRELYRAWTGDTEPNLPTAPQGEFICVWRRDEIVRHRGLDRNEAQALRGALAGETFGALCAAAAEEVEAEAAPGLAAARLGRWIDDGLIRATR